MSKVSGANLEEALRELTVEWHQTKAYWSDVKSIEFESNYLEPLPGLFHHARTIIDEIDTVLRKVRSDCE